MLTQERSVALAAVRAAARACQAVQQRLVRPETLEKKDKSPVTVADYASQAVVCGQLRDAFPADLILAEEDAAELRQDEQAPLRRIVVEHVAAAVDRVIGEATVMDWIDHGTTGRTAALSSARFWTLDPIDGTKGFLRSEQYAIALALLEGGQVVLGVLGCPNLLIDGTPGALLVAVRGQGAQILPLAGSETEGRPIRVSDVADPRRARFCESVESGHSNQDHSARIAQLLGITTPPLRMDSQAKYATVARGEAAVYLRMPTRADYREKIWDHAAGMLITEEAGGQVTDIDGKPLDFTHGATLAANRGVVATDRLIHAAVLDAIHRA